MTDDDLALAIIAGAVVLTSGPAKVISWGQGWVVPVPRLQFASGDYGPAISNPFGSAHAGVDLAWERRNAKDRPEYPAGSTSGTPRYFAPAGVPIFAARDGKVWSVSKTPRGWAVVLDHGAPFATFYQHLASTAFPEGVARGRPPIAVKAGDVIGTMGADPIDPEGFRHLHFAVWYKGAGDSASIDPARSMPSWRVLPWQMTKVES